MTRLCRCFRLNGPSHMFFLGGLLLALGVVVGRPYCRFLCPYGVILRLLSRPVTQTGDDHACRVHQLPVVREELPIWRDPIADDSGQAIAGIGR